MRISHASVLFLSIFLASCEGSVGSRGPNSEPFFDDRALLYNAHGILGEFDVLEGTQWPNDPRSTSFGTQFRVRLFRYMMNPRGPIAGLPPLGPGVEISLVLHGGQTIAGRTVSSPEFNDSPGRARVVTGRRLLLYAQIERVMVPYFSIARAWRVDRERGVVLEPCLGFPAGTPVSEILDPSTLNGVGDASVTRDTGAPTDRPQSTDQPSAR